MIVRGYVMMAKAGEEAALAGALAELATVLRGVDGFGGIETLHDRGNPGRFLFLEKWTSEAAHKAAGNHLPKELMDRLMTLLDSAPDGAYYDLAIGDA